MTGTGRPLRFLVALLGLWTGVRTVQLWPADEVALVANAVVPSAQAKPALAETRAALPEDVERGGHAFTVFRRALSQKRKSRAAAEAPVMRPFAGPVSYPTQTSLPAPASPQPQASLFVGAPLRSAPPAPSRFSGSFWLIARGGEGRPFVPQLGGSQAGVRLTYALDPARRVSLAARVSTALESRQQEAAIGLDWQPTALPIHLVAEQRIGIEQARGGPSLAVIGGIGPTPIAGELRLDAYAQGGAIARDDVEGFVDGAVRVSYPVIRLGRANVELGLGAWGAAQRGAARLDAGPAASVIVPVARRSVRLSVEWRQRLAGRATPASGPAVAVGTDF